MLVSSKAGKQVGEVEVGAGSEWLGAAVLTGIIIITSIVLFARMGRHGKIKH